MESSSSSSSSSKPSPSSSSWLASIAYTDKKTKSKYPDYPYEDHEDSIRRHRLEQELAEADGDEIDVATKTDVDKHDSDNDNDELIEKQIIRDDNHHHHQQQQKQQQQHDQVEHTVNVDDPVQSSKRTDRLNIILFYADDWTANVLGKMNGHVKTPNIDKMADNGVLFTDNCVISSVCWMSRATLHTGTYVSRNLQLDPHTDNMFKTHPWSETLWPRMKSAGYYTGLVGKWHAPQKRYAMKQAFDWTRLYYGFHEERRPDGTVDHITAKNRRDSIQFLNERPQDQNFFLKVSFFATHAIDGHFPSYIPMNGTRETHYPDSLGDLPRPKTATQRHWEGLPSVIFNEQNEGRNRWRKRFEPDYYQDNIRDLYSLATEVDAAVGDIMAELKKTDEGAYNNTLFIFTTDNGNLHGYVSCVCLLASVVFEFDLTIMLDIISYLQGTWFG
jgi:hypothetical protein